MITNNKSQMDGDEYPISSCAPQSALGCLLNRDYFLLLSGSPSACPGQSGTIKKWEILIYGSLTGVGGVIPVRSFVPTLEFFPGFPCPWFPFQSKCGR